MTTTTATIRERIAAIPTADNGKLGSFLLDDIHEDTDLVDEVIDALIEEGTLVEIDFNLYNAEERAAWEIADAQAAREAEEDERQAWRDWYASATA